MAPGLMDMPEDVMSKIIEGIGIKAMMTLRKVCHDLRNFIDDVKPDVYLDEITITETSKSIIVRYQYSGGNYHIEYIQQMEGCLVKNCNAGNGILLKKEDFLTVVMKDFEIVFGHQKSALKQFTLAGWYRDNSNEILLKNLQRILKSRVHPLKVEFFNAVFKDQNQLISILSLLDSKTLHKFRLKIIGGTLEVDQLIKLDQWKNIERLILDCDIDYEYIQNFTSFTTEYIRFKAAHFPDLVSLKNIFLHSSGFEIIEFAPTDYDLDNVQRSTELLGEASFEFGFKRMWYYRIPATNQVLEIKVNNENFGKNDISIMLSRIQEYQVPHAVIHN